MKNKYNKIYAELSSIEKLDKDEYASLVALYGAELTGSVIENLLDEKEENIFKFDYYVSMKLERFDNHAAGSLGIYMNDLNNYLKFSVDDNKRYTDEIYNIVCQLNKLLDTMDINDCSYEEVNMNSLEDKIQFYLDVCKDSNLLRQISELYGEFINLRNELVEGNLRFVVAMAKPFYRSNINFNEIIQNGNIGLIKAVEKFNPSFNASFLTYAYYWIRLYIIRGLRVEISPAPSVSYNLIEINCNRLRAINLLSNQLGRYPTYEELSNYMKLPIKKIYDIEQLFSDTIPLFNVITDDNEEELVDYIVDPSVDVSEEVISKQINSDIMKELINVLTDIERFVLIKKYGLNGEDEMTYKELSKELKMTGEGVRYIHERAKQKIKTNCSGLLVHLR